ncbi:MAG TPA: hypothetical protein DCZ63_09030 [Geobacter sp.]|nr:hypothetical protein [Geobacter sp.]
MTRYNVYLSAPQIDALRRIAEEKGVPVAELIRRAIDEWLERQTKLDGFFKECTQWSRVDDGHWG